MSARRIYLASSWRNPDQPEIIKTLRDAGHEVYDFRNPAPGNKGFAWSSIDPNWTSWDPGIFVEVLHNHPIAAAGFALDKDALDWCDTCILALPCGKSAHLEAGYAAGQGKDVYFLLQEDRFEPELMYLLGTRCTTNIIDILGWMTAKQPNNIIRWHEENGGFCKNPADHALRLLREVIELCVASGATYPAIQQAVTAEVDKAIERNEFGGAPDKVPEEWVDCHILLEVFRYYLGIDGEAELKRKMPVLWARKWEASSGGALYRPQFVPKEP